MKRAGIWAMLVIGVALVAMPIATGMFGKATAGQDMMKAFEPVMSKQSVATSVQYFDVFQGIGTDFTPVMTEQNVAKLEGYLQLIGRMRADVTRFIPAIAADLNVTPQQVRDMIAAAYPSMNRTLGSFDQIQADMGGLVATMSKDAPAFGQVDPALTHYSSLLSIMQAQVDNYAKANSLPPMGLLPWFLVVPGALIILISAGLLISMRQTTASHVPTVGRNELERQAA